MLLAVILAMPLSATCLVAQAQLLTCAGLKAEMQKNQIPDVAIAVFRHGRIATSYCSLAGTTLSPDSVFEAASLSKPVFAIGVLTLVKRHKLDLDRALSDYLNHPYEHEQNPFGTGPVDLVVDPRLKQVTARMVLSHTAGLPNWSRNQPLFFVSDPGERWIYSGEGYVYLQTVVESITGEPINVFLHEVVLQPLGMTHSSLEWQETFSRTMLPGHTTSGAPVPAEHFVHPLTSSTLYTTLNDYVRFVSRLLRPEPGSPFAMEEMKQVVVRADLDLAWGLGLAAEGSSIPSFFHWGASPGFQCFFLCQPKTHRAVLFFTDSDNGLNLVDLVVARSVPGIHPGLRFPMLHPKD